MTCHHCSYGGLLVIFQGAPCCPRCAFPNEKAMLIVCCCEICTTNAKRFPDRVKAALESLLPLNTPKTWDVAIWMAANPIKTHVVEAKVAKSQEVPLW